MEAAVRANSGFLRSNGAEKPELSKGRHSIIETDLLDDLAVLEFEDRNAGEAHFPARVGGQGTGKKVLESRTGVRAAAFPLTDDIVALGDEFGGAPEVQIGECRAEISHEGFDVFAT